MAQFSLLLRILISCLLGLQLRVDEGEVLEEINDVDKEWVRAVGRSFLWAIQMTFEEIEGRLIDYRTSSLKLHCEPGAYLHCHQLEHLRIRFQILTNQASRRILLDIIEPFVHIDRCQGPGRCLLLHRSCSFFH